MSGIADQDMPGFYRSADAASLQGQKWTLRLNRTRLGGSILAAIGGALTWSAGSFNVWGIIALLGFAAALAAEITLLVLRPEQEWHSGRALAESAKTLAWRYAVGGDPFFSTMSTAAAHAEMRDRLTKIAEKVGDRITIDADDPDITAAMEANRGSSFSDRKSAYIEGRTKDQRRWYANKAATAKKRAKGWQAGLILGEVGGLVVASGRAFSLWQVDLLGVVAAFVAAGAAWLSLKQYSALASAYTTAANELALQIGTLTDVSETEWPQAVADAEEAISREHTMWLATHAANL
ncbi:DUF4231 domain-containing protein [Nocardia sp. NBC_00508]|uniref:DUF4231 domain-containing protein n=1 Tax=Nocardia sp. NBC_00508 TaxID=2975992 RepID=UPI002E820EC9|nr:DUF4231 domain-containing protein [Nocardia sp. NBC_00508]WUD66609.1 DUF4231 domain-containing protein [Nocardia sp. NBC_00508]